MFTHTSALPSVFTVTLQKYLIKLSEKNDVNRSWANLDLFGMRFGQFDNFSHNKNLMTVPVISQPH